MAGDETFLSRWSRRKVASRTAPADSRTDAPAAGPEPEQEASSPVPAAASASAAQSTQPKPLPEIESLTPESDFAPFMSPGVGDDMRQKALKALFRDPHFSTVDMMDVYMEDFSLADPLPAGWLEKMEQVSHIGDRGGRDAEEAARRLAREKEGAGPGDGEVAAREDVADTSPGTERIDSPEPQPTVAGSASGDPPDADPDRQPSP